MDKDINLPISIDWSKDEVIDVVHFFDLIDAAYTKGVDRSILLDQYQKYKKVVPSQSEEKQHFKDYQEQSGQSAYHTIKMARENSDLKVINLK
ncbi:hypothetical protein CR203_02155 [Salipaludibacillus neizhouensis]|uniref:Uncharacterized protein n=1 Tax=Salipaludibacillus neizhouensis TaxID=885475 RepID=A0A3A9KWA8_9BACI|nr:UPF0223 family protein [Salipaludibacillus neizhouensis]RKL68866.1 hypothetical protein CR203_02155 [Salipaludibacillus neizhouensis]